MSKGEAFSSCVNNIKISSPQHQYEGVAGYIETDVTIDVKSLRNFAELWDSWYSLEDSGRIQWYRQASGMGKCK